MRAFFQLALIQRYGHESVRQTSDLVPIIKTIRSSTCQFTNTNVEVAAIPWKLCRKSVMDLCLTVPPAVHRVCKNSFQPPAFASKEVDGMRQTSKRVIKSSLPIPVVIPRRAAASRPTPGARRQAVRPINLLRPAKYPGANQPETPNHKPQLTAVKRADFAPFKGRHYAQLLLRRAQRITC